MPKQKVYREYFPTCIERFFGSGKPRRIKARCFVPYTQQEQNTDVYLGPSKDAPNIDLNMTVRKDKFGNLSASPDGDAFGNYGSCQELWAPDQYNPNGQCSPYAPCEPSPRTLDCGCSCRCSESRGSSSSGRSTTSTTEASSKSIKAPKFKNGKPKILVLENDGRYRPLGEEFVRTPEGIGKSTCRSDTSRAKLVVKEKKVDVVEKTEDEVSILPAECGLEICTKEKSKNGVVLGYVMYDPESEDKRPYVTTMDGKRITQQ